MKATLVGFGLVVAAFLVGVGGSLLGDEVKGWFARIPLGLLWIASRRVPLSHRDGLLTDWTADLLAELQDKNERPITRLVAGVRFAASLVRGSRKVATELGPIRDARSTGNAPEMLDGPVALEKFEDLAAQGDVLETTNLSRIVMMSQATPKAAVAARRRRRSAAKGSRRPSGRNASEREV